MIWSTYVQRKKIFDNFMIILPGKTVSLSIKYRIFLWKNHAENVHQKLVSDPFIILLNNPKQPLHARNSFQNKIF